MEIKRISLQIIDSEDRMCQKISKISDKDVRRDSNIRHDRKNRNGPMMWLHDRSPVIVWVVTGSS
jgi:hypothetical protein